MGSLNEKYAEIHAKLTPAYDNLIHFFLSRFIHSRMNKVQLL
jgi:hypothetical protein